MLRFLRVTVTYIALRRSLQPFPPFAAPSRNRGTSQRNNSSSPDKTDPGLLCRQVQTAPLDKRRRFVRNNAVPLLQRKPLLPFVALGRRPADQPSRLPYHTSCVEHLQTLHPGILARPSRNHVVQPHRQVTLVFAPTFPRSFQPVASTSVICFPARPQSVPCYPIVPDLAPVSFSPWALLCPVAFRACPSWLKNTYDKLGLRRMLLSNSKATEARRLCDIP